MFAIGSIDHYLLQRVTDALTHRAVHFTVRDPQLCVTHWYRKYLTKCLTVDVLEQAQKYF